MVMNCIHIMRLTAYFAHNQLAQVFDAGSLPLHESLATRCALAPGQIVLDHPDAGEIGFGGLEHAAAAFPAVSQVALVTHEVEGFISVLFLAVRAHPGARVARVRLLEVVFALPAWEHFMGCHLDEMVRVLRPVDDVGQHPGAFAAYQVTASSAD
jgi:hypothetical protein